MYTLVLKKMDIRCVLQSLHTTRMVYIIQKNWCVAIVSQTGGRYDKSWVIPPNGDLCYQFGTIVNLWTERRKRPHVSAVNVRVVYILIHFEYFSTSDTEDIVH